MTDEPDAAPVEDLETALGLRFDDRALLRKAVTHRSYLNEVDDPSAADNERLEFLGDALVDFVAGEFLYRTLPDASEGELTALRALLVCEDALARFARTLELGRYLRLGRGEAASGGRERSALLCDAFEALVGALLLDKGFATAEGFVMGFFEPELEVLRRERHLKDAKSRFQERVQRMWQITPSYATVEASGPDHDKRFVVEVRVGDRVFGRGRGGSKSAAARRAAQAGLARLEQGLPEDAPSAG